MSLNSAILFLPDGATVPDHLRSWIDAQELSTHVVSDPTDLMARALRARPRLVVFDARGKGRSALDGCRRMKLDSFTAIVPGVVLCSDDPASFASSFAAGADEVLMASTPTPEALRRLDAMMRRSDRDLQVHPSTRLCGAPAIEREITRRIEAGDLFAVCYADLDHFKEYNDRYSYTEGDRVIRILAKILHDVVKGLCGEEGFIGHIGGDDFIYIIPYASVPEVCGEIVTIFDALVPFQYSEQDRRAGYFFGKDRRGHLDRVPLMTLSIGVVTNLRRRFSHGRQVSQLATEMKTYAKTLPGSVYTVDRRTDERFTPPDSVPALSISTEEDSQ